MGEKNRKRQRGKKTESEDAEKKLQTLYGKRDTLNEEAKVYREERDQLNQEKQKLYSRIDALKLEREKAFEMLNIHKGKRDNYQSLAKELIRSRRDRSTDILPALVKEVAMLRTAIKECEWEQQTTPMSIKKERDLIEKLKSKQEELKAKERAMAKQSQVKGDIEDLSENITEMFQKADSEHALVQKHYTDAKAYKKEMDDTFEKIKDLASMADKCHLKFLKCRERADEFHQKATEMREQVMSIRRLAREERQKARELINEQNRQVKDTLEDEDKLDKAADDSLKALLQQKKITL